MIQAESRPIRVIAYDSPLDAWAWETTTGNLVIVALMVIPLILISYLLWRDRNKWRRLDE